MSTLEQAALSGTLTSIGPSQERDPDGPEPNRKQDDCNLKDLLAIHDDVDYDDFVVHQRAPAVERDGYGFLNPNQSSASPAGSQSMSRGWSGNTGPKGVLLDFKASHGKSGAILGGGNTLQSNYPRQISMSSALASKRSTPNTHRPTSSASDSDSSDSSDRDHEIRTNTPLCSSTKITTRLIFSDHHSNHRRRFGTSPLSLPSSPSALNNNPRLDSRGKKLFGHLREVGVENFIQAVEAEKDDKETVVLVHLYDPALESCLILNNHLSNLARVHPRTKFLRALASELDFFNQNPATSSTVGIGIPSLGTSPVRAFHSMNLMDDDPFDDEPRHSHADEVHGHIHEARTCKATDSDILPTLIWYRSGEYVQSLPALEREMPLGGIVRGEQGCKDLQRLLRKNGIITDSESVPL